MVRSTDRDSITAFGAGTAKQCGLKARAMLFGMNAAGLTQQ